MFASTPLQFIRFVRRLNQLEQAIKANLRGLGYGG
jgi:hypothetical protein